MTRDGTRLDASLLLPTTLSLTVFSLHRDCRTESYLVVKPPSVSNPSRLSERVINPGIYRKCSTGNEEPRIIVVSLSVTYTCLYAPKHRRRRYLTVDSQTGLLPTWPCINGPVLRIHRGTKSEGRVRTVGLESVYSPCSHSKTVVSSYP